MEFLHWIWAAGFCASCAREQQNTKNEWYLCGVCWEKTRNEMEIKRPKNQIHFNKILCEQHLLRRLERWCIRMTTQVFIIVFMVE